MSSCRCFFGLVQGCKGGTEWRRGAEQEWSTSVRIRRFLLSGVTLRILSSTSETCSREYAHGRRVASFRNRRTTSVDGSFVCPRRRIHYVATLRLLVVGHRVRIRVLRISAHLLRQSRNTSNYQVIRAFTRFPQVANFARLALRIAHDRVGTCHRYVVVTIHGTKYGILTRPASARGCFHLVVRLIKGIKSGREFTVFRCDQVKFRRGGQFLVLIYVSRLLIIRDVIRSCDGGLRCLVSLGFDLLGVATE